MVRISVIVTGHFGILSAAACWGGLRIYSGKSLAGYGPAVVSYPTRSSPPGPIGHDPGQAGHDPEIGGHDPGTGGHDGPKYAVDPRRQDPGGHPGISCRRPVARAPPLRAWPSHGPFDVDSVTYQGNLLPKAGLRPLEWCNS